MPTPPDGPPDGVPTGFSSDTPNADLPVIVIGAGPVGLAAAARLHAHGLEARVLEAGPRVGHAVRAWGHVRLFTPWRFLVDDPMRRLLDLHDWRAPDPGAHPTGDELVRELLEPLAELPEIAPMLALEHRVTAVTRLGLDRLKGAGRDRAPFEVIAETPGDEVRLRARAVIDASGTWTRPNPLGAGGVPASGERDLRARVRYGAPDPLGAERPRYAGRRTLVVGSGHTAFQALLDLAELAREAPGTTPLWAVRRPASELGFGGGASDALERRGRLGARARALLERGGVELLAGFRVARLERRGACLEVIADDGRSVPVDEVIAATGFRPDLDPTRELRLELDPVTEAPVRLAPLIDPNVHSCGTVPPHGEAELAHPERDFYTVGMKSYGRAPTFLLLTGYEQVRSVVARLAGDHAAARRVELELPATGVCSTGLGSSTADPAAETAAPSGACCGTASAAPPFAGEASELPMAAPTERCCD